MDSMTDGAFTRYANVHRGAHRLSGLATASYEGARARLQAFLNAPGAEQVIFTKSATEAINLVASAFAAIVAPGDEIIVSSLRSEEHTSELQSLMRISYAVFCLHKKKH